MRAALRVLRVNSLGLVGLRLLGFDDDALEFFKNSEVLVSRVNLGVALFFAGEETNFFEAFQLALNVSRVFFD
jgi:hypothetical protein